MAQDRRHPDGPHASRRDSPLIILIISSVKYGGLRGNHMLYRGSCSTASTINTIAHLLINVLATGVLASSNFFMQVLNAPTRSDLDRIHGEGKSWADIGVPSFRNLRFMARWKTAAWLLLALSSAPLHLFFNSTVFQSDDVRSKYQLVMAAEGFFHGAPWFSPGASLREDGLLRPDDYNDVSWLRANVRSPPESLKRLAREAGGWKRLSPSECRSAYLYSKGIRGYGDVVIIVDSPEPGGWKRGDVFSGNETFDRVWDEIGIPADASNSVWHNTYCESEHGWQGCWQDGGDGGKAQWHSFSCYHLFDKSNSCYRSADDDGSLGAEWAFSYNGAGSIPAWERVGYHTTPFNSISVKYCMAEAVPEDCKVAISNRLLGITLLAISAKLAVACYVYLSLSGSPLITPGDAIVSFICRPDKTTRGRCTFGRVDFEKQTGSKFFSWFGKRPQTVGGANPLPPPRRWTPVRARWIAAMPITSLGLTYTLSIALLAALGVFFREGYLANGGIKEAGFGRSSSSYVEEIGKAGILSLALYANLPQLALSIVYLQHNALMTRMLSAREWASYRDLHPLRVTSPAPGSKQISTWRLQLPYRYGVPLVVSSVLMHWLVSNCVYVVVVEGGEYLRTYGEGGFKPKISEAGLGEDTSFTVGYSLQAMVVTLVVGVVAVCVPVGLGMRRLWGGMPVVGSNSMAISAACHVLVGGGGDRSAECSEEESQVRVSGRGGVGEAMEMERLMTSRGRARRDAEAEREALSGGLLRWGVVDAGNEGDMDPVGHLSLGGSGQVVGGPVPGRLYA